MGFSEVVQWWEDRQLRILVLGSLILQCFLYVASFLRKFSIPSFFRLIIWLAYLGSDAVAIYAIATLFNRHNTHQERISTHGTRSSLELLWAPVLLIHLGGLSGITAYNIEDNELWRRHVLTVASQVSVAVYVFWKSWSGDRKLLFTANCLFFLGILKCILKPWYFKRVSLNSLVGLSCSQDYDERERLDKYVKKATEYFQPSNGRQPPTSPTSHGFCNLWVDLATGDSARLGRLEYLANNGKEAHSLIKTCLCTMFIRLYSKDVFVLEEHSFAFLHLMCCCLCSCTSLLMECLCLGLDKCIQRWVLGCICFIQFVASIMGIVAAASFESLHKEAYDKTDLIITQILLWFTVVLDIAGPSLKLIANDAGATRWPDQISQYNLIGYLARNKRHLKLRKLTTLLCFEDNLDQLWCMKPCKSSSDITEHVHGYLAEAWTEHRITDTATFRAFSGNRGQWTLSKGCGSNFESTLQRPFDESVLIWHLATDFCFHHTDTSPSHEEVARRSRQISNYMVYLLFINPEMLMTGARRSLFKAICSKLTDVLKENSLPEGTKMPHDEKQLTKVIIQRVRGINGPTCGIILDAWELAKGLMKLQREKMWKVIQGVWVEMLCFSASRCRGYLHAKSLANGGEYLSYVWLLWLFMGMETLAERTQMTGMLEVGNKGSAAEGSTTASAAAYASEIRPADHDSIV